MKPLHSPKSRLKNCRPSIVLTTQQTDLHVQDGQERREILILRGMRHSRVRKPDWQSFSRELILRIRANIAWPWSIFRVCEKDSELFSST